MKSTSRTILFFGTDDFSLYSLKALYEAGFIIGGIITKPDSRKGRGQKIIEPSVKRYAKEKNIPFIQPSNSDEMNKFIIQFKQPVGVLVSFGKIINQETLNLFTPGIINLHPSLLPQYRGPSPIEAAILNGDKSTGVTIMKLTPPMDAGPIYIQKEIKLDNTETQGSLYEQLGKEGAQLLVDTLPLILRGLMPHKQNDSLASYCPMLKKEDALIDPNLKDASYIERHVRAYAVFPRTKYSISNMQIIITKASLENKHQGIPIHCKDKSFIYINELIAPNGKRMTGTSFTNGYLR